MIKISISLGELLDRTTILELKSIKISNPSKLIWVEAELNHLQEIIKKGKYLKDLKIAELKNNLFLINAKLWTVEDLLRVKEQQKTFDDEFIQMARIVYLLNDERFRVKNEINEMVQSSIREVKELPQ
jgi:hypothetical protein